MEHMYPSARGGSNRVSNTRIQRADGYGYVFTKIALQKGGAGMRQALLAALSLPG